MKHNNVNVLYVLILNTILSIFCSEKRFAFQNFFAPPTPVVFLLQMHAGSCHPIYTLIIDPLLIPNIMFIACLVLLTADLNLIFSDGIKPQSDVQTVPFDEVAKTLNTGDIVLFTGATSSGAIIRLFDNAEFSHSGIVRYCCKLCDHYV